MRSANRSLVATILAFAPVFTGANVCIAAAAPHAITPCEAAVRGDQRARSYETVMRSQAEGNKISETVDVQKPDRFHTIAMGREMITVGKNSWYYIMGRWHAVPSLPGTPQGPQSAGKDPARSYADKPGFVCKDVGTTVWHGQPAHEYKSLYTSGYGPVETTMFVMHDGYIHHVDMKSAHGSNSYDYSKFNNVRIDPPKGTIQ